MLEYDSSVPGAKQRRVRDGDLDKLSRCPGVAEVAGEVWGKHDRVVFEVSEPTGVVQQLADADRFAGRDESGKPALDGVAEAELALADELEDNGCGVCLGQARNPEAIRRPHRCLRADLSEAAADADRAVAVSAQQYDTRGAGRDERVGVLLQRRLRVGAAGRGRGCGDDEGCGRQARENPAAEPDGPAPVRSVWLGLRVLGGAGHGFFLRYRFAAGPRRLAAER